MDVRVGLLKKAEHQRIDAFELCCWARLFRVPWTARRSNQSILKEISPGCSLVGLMLKLKLQYFGHLMWRADSLEKTLMLVKIEGRRRRGQQRMRSLDGITDLMDMSLSRLQELVVIDKEACVLQSMGCQRVGYNWATELSSMTRVASPVALMVLFLFLDSWYIMCLGASILEFILCRFYRTFWICRLMYFIDFGVFSAIISLHVLSVSFSLFPFWDSHNACFGLLVILQVP